MADGSYGEGTTKVMVVDDHPVVRQAVAAVLREAGYLVFEAGDGQEAIELAASVRPDLVIMDVFMPGISGIEATERIRARDPAVRVVMFSVADSPETVRVALKAGATSYLSKASASMAVLLDAVRRTVAGESVLVPSSLVGALVRDSEDARQPEAPGLTARELEIVALASQGSTSAEIARQLALSPRTVENHIGRIFRKLGISNRAQLARIAADRRIDRPPWAGLTSVILFIDIESFGHYSRDDEDRMGLRQAMYNITRSAVEKSGIPWSACRTEDRGDGVVIILPPEIPASSVAGTFLATLADGLRHHNRNMHGPMLMRLRVALHAGPVTFDEYGISGEAISRAARMLDTHVLKERLALGMADMGVIVSDSVYNEAIRQGPGRPDWMNFDRVDIKIKETETTAWLWTGGGPQPEATRNFWAALSEGQREGLRALAASRTFAAGARLTREGERAAHVAVLLSGRVRISVHENGRERILAERGPGALVGERAALQASVRSATVVALETVQALIVKTEDFTAFLRDHPAVLQILGNQIYDRLLEGAGDRGNRTERPLSGQNCTIIYTDIAGFAAAARSDLDRLAIRDATAGMTRATLEPFWDACSWEDRGDGLMVIVPPVIPTTMIMERLMTALPAELNRHNGSGAPATQVQLRVALTVGPVVADDVGVTGEAIVHASRMLDAPELKKAMAETGAALCVVVSDFVYEMAIKYAEESLDPGMYAKVRVKGKKTFSTVWMKLITPAPGTRFPRTPGKTTTRDSPPRLAGETTCAQN